MPRWMNSWAAEAVCPHVPPAADAVLQQAAAGRKCAADPFPALRFLSCAVPPPAGRTRNQTKKHLLLRQEVLFVSTENHIHMV